MDLVLSFEPWLPLVTQGRWPGSLWVPSQQLTASCALGQQLCCSGSSRPRWVPLDSEELLLLFHFSYSPKIRCFLPPAGVGADRGFRLGPRLRCVPNELLVTLARVCGHSSS